MKFDLVVEGRGDVAVIQSLLKGALNVDRSDIYAIRPEDQLDNTDIASKQMNEEHYSNWTLVKQECQEGSKIKERFKNFVENRYLIVQIDTDTRFDPNYDVQEPREVNSRDEVEQLVCNVKRKIQSWLGEEIQQSIPVLYAIAVQEIDAWLLALWDEKAKETGNLPDAKGRLENFLNNGARLSQKKKNIYLRQKRVYTLYLNRSEGFSKKRIINQARTRNKSLDLFIAQLEGLKVEDQAE